MESTIPILIWFGDNGRDLLEFTTLLGTIIGFYFTFREIRKTREAVQETVEKISLRIFSNDISTSVKLIRELRESGKSLNWPRAVDKCEQLRGVLASLVENPSLTKDDSEQLSSSIDDITLILQHIESIISGNKKPLLTAKMQQFIMRFEVQLIKLESRLRNPLTEANNDKR